MELVLIRHGESIANQQGVVQGHFDSPLSEAGRLQARALAEVFRDEAFSAIYASDLSRAKETGQAIADRLGQPLAVDPLIRELDIGIFSGLSWAEISVRYPADYRRFKETGKWSVVPGAEGEKETRARLDAFINRLTEHHAGSRIAVVAHGAILRRMIHVLLDLPFPSGVFFELHNASFTEVHLTPLGPTLLYLNRVSEAAVTSATTRSLI